MVYSNWTWCLELSYEQYFSRPQNYKTFGSVAQDGEQQEFYPQNSCIFLLKIVSVHNFVLIPSYLRLSHFENVLSLSLSLSLSHTQILFLIVIFFIEQLGIFVK